jgi:hypothetical protein
MGFFVLMIGKGTVVAKEKRSVLDDLADGVRGLIDEIDRLLNPEKRAPQRALVPIPVRPTPPRPTRRDPYYR